MTEYPNITPRETTGEDAASAAGKILSDDGAVKIMVFLEAVRFELETVMRRLDHAIAGFEEYRTTAKTAAASALTQVEPNP